MTSPFYTISSYNRCPHFLGCSKKANEDLTFMRLVRIVHCIRAVPSAAFGKMVQQFSPGVKGLETACFNTRTE